MKVRDKYFDEFLGCPSQRRNTLDYEFFLFSFFECNIWKRFVRAAEPRIGRWSIKAGTMGPLCFYYQFYLTWRRLCEFWRGLFFHLAKWRVVVRGTIYKNQLVSRRISLCPFNGSRTYQQILLIFKRIEIFAGSLWRQIHIKLETIFILQQLAQNMGRYFSENLIFFIPKYW